MPVLLCQVWLVVSSFYRSDFSLNLTRQQFMILCAMLLLTLSITPLHHIYWCGLFAFLGDSCAECTGKQLICLPTWLHFLSKAMIKKPILWSLFFAFIVFIFFFFFISSSFSSSSCFFYNTNIWCDKVEMKGGRRRKIARVQHMVQMLRFSILPPSWCIILYLTSLSHPFAPVH